MNVRRLAALAAGALLACAFAPLQWWPLAIICPAVLMYLWEGATPREAAWLGFCFNAGTFAAGTYWLYVSLHIFGEAPVYIAAVLMLALVAIMGLYHAALGYVVARWLPERGALRWMVAVPAAWLLVEWWRGWFLSGFSWLSLGYSQTDTWLSRVAPIAGVYGISAVLLVCAGALTAMVLGSKQTRITAAIVFVVPWIVAAALGSVEWTHPSGPPVTVAVVQGSIPQDQKWLDSNKQTTLDLYQRLTETALGTRLIVWPESAPPVPVNDIVDYITNVYREARSHHSALVTGSCAIRKTGEWIQLDTGAGRQALLVQQGPPRTVRGILPGTELRAFLAAAAQPAVFGLHARRRQPAAAAGRRPESGRHHMLRGRVRQLHDQGVACRRRARQRHQRCLVRPFERPAPTLSNRPDARDRSAAGTSFGLPTMAFRASSARTAKWSPGRRNSRPMYSSPR